MRKVKELEAQYGAAWKHFKFSVWEQERGLLWKIENGNVEFSEPYWYWVSNQTTLRSGPLEESWQFQEFEEFEEVQQSRIETGDTRVYIRLM